MSKQISSIQGLKLNLEEIMSRGASSFNYTTQKSKSPFFLFTPIERKISSNHLSLKILDIVKSKSSKLKKKQKIDVYADYFFVEKDNSKEFSNFRNGPTINVKLSEENNQKKLTKKIIKKKKLLFIEKKKRKKELMEVFHINQIIFDYLISLFYYQNQKKIFFKDLQKLTSESKSFLYFILQRKMFKKNFSILNSDLLKNTQLIKEKMEEFKSFDSEKRFEEEFSFVYKAFFNYEKKYKNWNDQEINSYYFSEISVIKEIEIQNFIDPSKKKIKNPSFRTFSEEYLNLIIQSNLFQNDFIFFLNFTLEKVYFRKLEKKFIGLYKKIENILIEKNISSKMKNKEIDRIIFKIYSNYFKKNNQCKLPWCVSEMKKAIDKVKKKINEFNKKKR